MSIKKLPPMETTFSIDIEGQETGKKYSGTFTYKRPNLRAKSQISKTTARLNEDLRNLDEDTQFIHSVLSTLRHTLTPQEGSDWWEKCDYGYELYDMNVILEMYRKCQEFENEWFKTVWAEEDTPVENAKE